MCYCEILIVSHFADCRVVPLGDVHAMIRRSSRLRFAACRVTRPAALPCDDAVSSASRLMLAILLASELIPRWRVCFCAKDRRWEECSRACIPQLAIAAVLWVWRSLLRCRSSSSASCSHRRGVEVRRCVALALNLVFVLVARS